jgi:hypothetical protein
MDFMEQWFFRAVAAQIIQKKRVTARKNTATCVGAVRRDGYLRMVPEPGVARQRFGSENI